MDFSVFNSEIHYTIKIWAFSDWSTRTPHISARFQSLADVKQTNKKKSEALRGSEKNVAEL